MSGGESSSGAGVAAAVAGQFALDGRVVECRRYGSGHINLTYLVVTDRGRRYLLQRINDLVFTRPRELMDNVGRVTMHVRDRLAERGVADLDRRVLTLVPTKAGEPYLVDDEDKIWRIYLFVAGAVGYDVVASEEQAYEAARAFGDFQLLLADYDGPRLHETIPQFHDTPNRVRQFREAVAADAYGRVKDVGPQIDWLEEHVPMARSLVDLQAAGVLPERVTHNDTKLNNVLLDEVTGDAVCVLDLDTVMPGVSLYDFGDLARTATMSVAEDEPDASAVEVMIPMYEALARGFVEGTGGSLLPAERERLLDGAQVITLENAYRFLADYLNGDVYYPVTRPRHNVERAGTQMALVDSFARHADRLRSYAAALPE